eukprot:g7889.t1
MVLVAKGYRVVPQSLADHHGRGFRHVHLKEHRGVFKAAARTTPESEGGQEVVFPKGKTLFVGNIDDQGGRLCRASVETRLKRALSSCGDILHVQVSAAVDPGLGVVGADGAAGVAPPVLGGGRSASAARFAHVCFSSAKGVQRALRVEEFSSITSRRDSEATADGFGAQNGTTDPEEESRDEDGDQTCGYAALIQQHRRKFPPRQALQLEVDATMQRFEKGEAEREAERKALLEKPEDDDGFVTVTYKRKRGRKSSGNHGLPAHGGGVVASEAKKKRKGAGELSDFYRFQMRETRREQLASLRSKFEQDKARVAKMKEQRKFRPPTDMEKTMLQFCPNQQFGGDVFLQYGSCCTDLDEVAIEAKFLETSRMAPNGQLTDECADLYKQLVCIQCHSFSNHLFERLGNDFGLLDGMNLKQEYCDALVSACGNQIDFGGPAEYGGLTYCEQHVGPNGDEFWSYPYTDPPILEPGLNDVFPNIAGDDLPGALLTVRMTPDKSEFWIGGREGKVIRVDASDRETNQFSEVIDISTTPTFWLDLETGLIDLAHDPKFSQNSFFYLSHTVDLGTGDFNDLYWNAGDGGPQSDTIGAAQDLDNLLGSMMKISVPTFEGYESPEGKKYDIPPGNYQEVRDSTAAPEVCAVGLRNPWRCSFDDLDDTLWCGDVGQSSVETIKVIEEWVNGVINPQCSEDMDRSAIEFPIYEYCHSGHQSTNPVYTGGKDYCGDREIIGNAVIGGYVYRGAYFSDLLAGAYIFADYEKRNVYFLEQNENDDWVTGTIISDGTARVVSFAEDENGEILLITSEQDIFYLPCGDLCSSTCLDQAEQQPDVERVGCYGDSTATPALTLDSPSLCGEGERFMSPKARQIGGKISKRVCASYCATVPGAVYAGVEDGTDCYCGAAGEEFDKNGALDDESCGTLCEAVPDSTCGGLDAIEIYTFETLATPAPAAMTPGGPSPNPAPDTPTDLTSGANPALGIAYLGCYQDGKTRGGPPRIFTGDNTISQDNSAVFCSQFCAGYDFFGTQYSRDCWCTDGTPDTTYLLYEELDESDCNMPCTGEPTEFCGGPSIMAVYEIQDQPTGTPPPVALPTPSPVTLPTSDPVAPTGLTSGANPAEGIVFLGCFQDGKTRGGPPRIFTGKDTKNYDSNSALFCKQYCADYDFYGTQYGRDCWCGNGTPETTYLLYGELDVSECFTPCTGEPTEFCGGTNIMAVYVTQDQPTGTPPPVALPTPAPVTLPTSDPVAPTGLTSGANPAEGIVFLGCFQDGKTRGGPPRIFTGKDTKNYDSNSALFCKQYCADYDFYGTQYGRDCWCGNGTPETTYLLYGELDESDGAPRRLGTPRVFDDVSYSDTDMTGLYGRECWCGSGTPDETYLLYGELDDSECATPCTGDPSEACGGANALTVYVY